jgi:hypothetical protein
MADTAELHATWEGYLLSKIDGAEWRVFKVEGEGEQLRIAARYTVRRGKCECEGFTRHLDCRHVKMIQHRLPPVTRDVARAAALQLVRNLNDAGTFDRIVLDGYEYDPDAEADGKDAVISRALVRVWGDPLEVDGVKHWRVFGLMKKGALVEVKIQER